MYFISVSLLNLLDMACLPAEMPPKPSPALKEESKDILECLGSFMSSRGMILCINTSISSQEGWNEPDEYNDIKVNSRDSYSSPYQSKIVLLILNLIYLRVNLVLKNHSFYF